MTMSKPVKIFIGAAIILILMYSIWSHLPLSMQRYSDIKFGNQLVSNLTEYKLSTRKLPKEGDWKTLESLKFKMTELGTQPDYKKLNDTTFELIFLEGFDGPYLTYSSLTKKWTMKY